MGISLAGGELSVALAIAIHIGPTSLAWVAWAAGAACGAADICVVVRVVASAMEALAWLHDFLGATHAVGVHIGPAAFAWIGGAASTTCRTTNISRVKWRLVAAMEALA